MPSLLRDERQECILVVREPEQKKKPPQQKFFLKKQKKKKKKKKKTTTTYGHVIASPILLNRRLALGTLLRIRIDPIRRLRVVRTLLDPSLQQQTQTRPVVREPAVEAKLISAPTFDHGDDPVEGCLRGLALDRVLAVGRGAVAQVLPVVNKGPVRQLAVPTRGRGKKKKGEMGNEQQR
jgi:hypothetical protein